MTDFIIIIIIFFSVKRLQNHISPFTRSECGVYSNWLIKKKKKKLIRVVRFDLHKR